MEKTPNKVMKTSIRLVPDLRKRVDETIHRLRWTPDKVTFEQAVQAGLELWIEQQTKVPERTTPAPKSKSQLKSRGQGMQNVSAEEAAWLQKLLRVLRSGEQSAVQAVTSNIEVFSEFCDVKAEWYKSRTADGPTGAAHGNPAQDPPPHPGASAVVRRGTENPAGRSGRTPQR